MNTPLKVSLLTANPASIAGVHVPATSLIAHNVPGPGIRQAVAEAVS